MSLDGSDCRADVFWTYVLTALERAAPGSAGAGLALLESGQPIETVLTAVLNELSVLPERPDPRPRRLPPRRGARDIQPGMALLLERLPPQVSLVIGTRADPALPLARLRSRGELTEVRAADLRFTEDETARYLADGHRSRPGRGRRRRARGPYRGLDRLAPARRALAAGP